MEHLFWPDPRKLTSLHPEEPEAAAARGALAAVLAKGLKPMRDYLDCFKRWGTTVRERPFGCLGQGNWKLFICEGGNGKGWGG
jgi:hypothetical protein